MVIPNLTTSLSSRSPTYPSPSKPPSSTNLTTVTTSAYSPSTNLSPPETPPIILTVTRRHIRKNKWVEVAGHYHLSLLTENGCLPLVLPRTPQTSTLLPSTLYPHISGLLLTEGEDISPEYFRGERLNEVQRACVGKQHKADSMCDIWKDHLEFRLVQECLERGVPILGICRGMQVVNLVRGGDMYEDIGVQLGGGKHIDYENYDGFRHKVFVGKESPLEKWFDGELQGGGLNVTSYHHQGVRTLGKGLKGMAWSEEGLIEGYYDEGFSPKDGKFVVGLQFHPERMQDANVAVEDQAMGICTQVFEYEGCRNPYVDFCTAAWAYKRKRDRVNNV